MFEDFNYGNFNKYILIDPDRTEQPEEEAEEFPGGFVPQVLSKNPRGKPIYNEDDKQAVPLSEKGLEASCQGSYRHDLLDIDTEQEKEKAEELEQKRLREERER